MGKCPDCGTVMFKILGGHGVGFRNMVIISGLSGFPGAAFENLGMQAGIAVGQRGFSSPVKRKSHPSRSMMAFAFRSMKMRQSMQGLNPEP